MSRLPERFSIDPPLVTADEACELMLHHLRLAAAYFEATPEDRRCAQLLQELERQRKMEEPGPWPWLAPSVDFIRQIAAEYARMEKGVEEVEND